MKKFKPILRCVIFLTGLIVIMGVIDFACVQTGYVNYILRNVCVKNNKTDYDTVIIGFHGINLQNDSGVWGQKIPGARRCTKRLERGMHSGYRRFTGGSRRHRLRLHRKWGC